jgi:hypothetical protein
MHGVTGWARGGVPHKTFDQGNENNVLSGALAATIKGSVFRQEVKAKRQIMHANKKELGKRIVMH